MARPSIVWGSKGQSRVVFDILCSEGSSVIHLFDNDFKAQSALSGVPLSYGEKGLAEFAAELKSQGKCTSEIDCIAAIGGGHGDSRVEMTCLMAAYGFQPRSLVHRASIISAHALLGRNVQILAGATIAPFASIGDYSIINSGANVDHDCRLGSACHVAPNAAIAGEVVIEDQVFVGTNATVLPGLRIGFHSVIGAGSVVTKSLPPNSIVVGNPARPLYRD